MCYICLVRFLCSVYRLVHHCSARPPCALGPWRDLVLAPLSITRRIARSRARCAGGGMCCSRGASLSSDPSASPWRQRTLSFVISMARFYVFLYSGLIVPAWPPALSLSVSVRRRTLFAFNDRGQWGSNWVNRWENQVGFDPPDTTQLCGDTWVRAI